ncbi:LOW QUALITY PROTEIN: hypothetical protein CVT25_006842 [Psilocybe cyanescens]|uniref:Uncharacterized protein n=1 Tax=Psilocybe cyanescens TaxID=93625 RepID=A0A409X792_PSICY|nr:LOW QUALITY PROTEIN: hypothetical protein CVT25_006842 [Psilocybe cyanescens]
MSIPADIQLWIASQKFLRTTFKNKLSWFPIYSTYNPMPAAILERIAWVEKDPTIYLTIYVFSYQMNSPSEFHITGPLKD